MAPSHIGSVLWTGLALGLIALWGCSDQDTNATSEMESGRVSTLTELHAELRTCAGPDPSATNADEIPDPERCPHLVYLWSPGKG